jgi:hypothetical protein
MNDRGVMFAPRFGFAYDLTGDGKTAIRGGFGMFYQRQGLTLINAFSNYPPLVLAPTIYYGTMATMLSSSGVVFPSTVGAVDQSGSIPTVMNYSLSVQRNIGWRTVVDVGYVASLGRHLLWQRNLNPVPMGANFSAANADPTISGAVLDGEALSEGQRRDQRDHGAAERGTAARGGCEGRAGRSGLSKTQPRADEVTPTAQIRRSCWPGISAGFLP